MNKTTLTILEIVWGLVGIFCIVAAIHNKINSNGERFMVLFGMGLLAFVMAFLRHKQRKKD